MFKVELEYLIKAYGVKVGTKIKELNRSRKSENEVNRSEFLWTVSGIYPTYLSVVRKAISRNDIITSSINFSDLFTNNSDYTILKG